MRKLIKSKTRRILVKIFCALFLCLGFYIGRGIPWGTQSTMYEIFRQVGVLILGVIGAWLAVLLPFSIEKGDKLKNFFAFSKRLFPALTSAIYILSIGIFIPIIAEILRASSLYADWMVDVFRGISMSLLFAGGMLIAYGFSMMLSSFDALKTDIERFKNAENVKKIVGPQNRVATTNTHHEES